MNEKIYNDNGLTKIIGCEKKDDTPQQQTVMTNMGEIPIEDYREIVAIQNGFNSYEDMYNQGIRIEDPETQKGYNKTELTRAIYTNDIETVKEIIKCDKQLMEDYCDWAGETPLHTAVKAGSYRCVDELLKNGAYPDAFDVKRNTPLYYAINNNNTKTAELLLKAGADSNLKNGDGLNLCYCAYSRDMQQLIDSYSIERKNSTHRSLHLK